MVRKLILVGMVGWIMACCCSLPVLSWNTGEVVDGFAGWQTVRGKGPVVSEERSLPDFSELDLLGEGDVYIEVGEQTAVRVEAQENLLPYLETEVEGNTLRIRTRKGANLYSTEPIRFYVTVRALNSIQLSGSGDIFVKTLSADQLNVNLIGSGNVRMDDLDSDRLKLRLGGSGKIELDELNANEIDTDIFGSGNVRISGGSVDTQEVQITGSGNYNSEDLSSRTADVKIPGSGSVTLRVSDQLSISIFGSGDVRYYGSPSVDQTIVGSGSILQLGK